MTEQEVISLMESSKNESEWNRNCDRVKAAFGAVSGEGRTIGAYPVWWFPRIIASGLAERVAARFV